VRSRAPDSGKSGRTLTTKPNRNLDFEKFNSQRPNICMRNAVIVKASKPTFDKTRSVGFRQCNSSLADLSSKPVAEPRVAYSQPGPLKTQAKGSVQRISPELVPPPQSLRANYRAFKGSVRVRAIPIDSANELFRWVGAKLALPRISYRRSTHQLRLAQLRSTTPTSLAPAKGE